MNAFIVGASDGSHLWMQWDEQDAPDGYEVRLSYGNGPEWSERTPAMHCRQAWLSFNPHLPAGTLATGEVRVRGVSRWTDMEEAKFTRSRCLFLFTSTRKRVVYLKGSMFHSAVDGAACSYKLTADLEVPEGEFREVEMEAVASSGWAQLDATRDFVLRPDIGVEIVNLLPSQNDVEPTGRGFTVIEPMKIDGPATIAFLPRTEL